MSKQSLQEQSVIDGLKRGDNWAYKHLYDHYHVLLRSIAFSFLKDDFLARALVNDLFIYFYKNRETLVIHPPLRPYFVRAIKNNCLKYLDLKHQKMEVKLSSVNVSDDNPFAFADEIDCPHAILSKKELEQEIKLAIERLSPECQTVFEKSRFEGKNHEQIAAELSISVNTVKYHIKNALLRLRKDLEKFLLLILTYLQEIFIF
jgi:RNA polymerase sigma-70 factor (ECF subfamily)